MEGHLLQMLGFMDMDRLVDMGMMRVRVRIMRRVAVAVMPTVSGCMRVKASCGPKVSGVGMHVFLLSLRFVRSSRHCL